MLGILMLPWNASLVALKKEEWSPLDLSSPVQSGWWVSTLQCWNCTHVRPHLTFYVGAGDGNSGSQACLASFSLPEPFPGHSDRSLICLLCSSTRNACTCKVHPPFLPIDGAFELENSAFCLSPISVPPSSALGPLSSVAHGDFPSQQQQLG